MYNENFDERKQNITIIELRKLGELIDEVDIRAIVVNNFSGLKSIEVERDLSNCNLNR